MFTAVVATLAVNIAANVVSPANDFANAFPRAIDFQTGGLITGILGIADDAVEAARRSVRLHLHVAARYSGGLGSIAGVLIADYWVVRQDAPAPRGPVPAGRRVPLPAGWNWRAVAATLLGCAFAWGGLVIPALKPLYDYAWFVGFGVAFVVYVVLMRWAPARRGRRLKAFVNAVYWLSCSSTGCRPRWAVRDLSRGHRASRTPVIAVWKRRWNRTWRALPSSVQRDRRLVCCTDPCFESGRQDRIAAWPADGGTSPYLPNRVELTQVQHFRIVVFPTWPWLCAQ